VNIGDVLRLLVAVLLYPILPTVSVAELVWVVAGFVAVRANFSGWRRRFSIRREAMRRRATLDARQVLIACQRHSAEAFAFGIQIGLCALGLVAAVAPEPPPREFTPEQAAITLLFDLILLGMQIALAVGSVLQRRYDRTLAAMPSVRAMTGASETGTT
jgi:hypothetical protein